MVDSPDSRYGDERESVRSVGRGGPPEIADVRIAERPRPIFENSPSSSESESSQPESHGGSGAELAPAGGPDMDVFVEVPALCEAAVEANEELALGGCGSGVNVAESVSHPSGLRLRSRSPRPFMSLVKGRRGTDRSWVDGP